MSLNELEPEAILGHESEQSFENLSDLRARPFLRLPNRDDEAKLAAPVGAETRCRVSATAHHLVGGVDIGCDVEEIGKERRQGGQHAPADVLALKPDIGART